MLQSTDDGNSHKNPRATTQTSAAASTREIPFLPDCLLGVTVCHPSVVLLLGKPKERFLDTSGAGEHAPPSSEPTGPAKHFLRDLDSSWMGSMRSTTEGPP